MWWFGLLHLQLKFYQMTHTERIITCLSLHTLLTAVSSGQEGAKALNTLLSPSSRGQIKALPPAFWISAFLPQLTPVQKFSVSSFIYTFISITYIYICIYTQIQIETICILTSTFSTLFAPVRCVTRVIRNTTKWWMAREWVAVAASKLLVKSASSQPKCVCQKMIVRKTKLSRLFWNNTVALSLTSLLYFSHCQH